MLIILLSILISSGVTTLVYVSFQQRAKSTEIVRFRRRLGVETEAERLAEAETPSLIRATRRNESGWLCMFDLQRRWNEQLQVLIESSGVKAAPESIVKACAIAALAAGGTVSVVASGWFCALALPAAVIAGFLPIWRLRGTAGKRLARFESQFPGALEFIARSMRAGHAFSVSLEMLYRESEQPVAGEFRRVFEEQNLGMPLDAALIRLAARVRIIDVQFFVSAVILQRRTGGNLTEILDTLAQVIRERYKLKGKVKAISAHGRMTAKALSSIPIVVGGLMFFVNHEYVNFFFHTVTGLEMLSASVVLQIIAYVVINRIVDIKV